jgi:hypothetical protein
MKRMHALLILLAFGCGGGSSGSTDDGDSTDDGTSADDGGPATAPSDDDDDGTPSTGDDDDGESSSASTTDTPESTSAADDDGTTTADDTGPSDDATSGGPTNDCTNEKDPCVLELDATVAGAGGVDQFFVYTVGDGNEHVEFTGIQGDYVSWLGEPWAFGCNLDGSCCQSDGATTCDKPLAQEFLEFSPGDTAYVFVFANAPYELTITSG